MKEQLVPKPSNGTMELVTFYAGEALCGLDIRKIQEINKLMEITPVPLAPEYIEGIMNLRGQIVTIIDLCKRLGLSSRGRGEASRNIVVNGGTEYIGLLVDQISDVVKSEWDKIEPPPANMHGIQGRYFEGVHKTEKKLIGILKVEEVLKIED